MIRRLTLALYKGSCLHLSGYIGNSKGPTLFVCRELHVSSASLITSNKDIDNVANGVINGKRNHQTHLNKGMALVQSSIKLENVLLPFHDYIYFQQLMEE